MEHVVADCFEMCRVHVSAMKVHPGENSKTSASETNYFPRQASRGRT